MKYKIAVIVTALILTALALTSCVESCTDQREIITEDGRPHLYVNGQRHVQVTNGRGGIDWVAR